jgi:type IV secretion system protein VirB1
MRTERRGHSCWLMGQLLPNRASCSVRVCVVWVFALTYLTAPCLAHAAPLSRDAFGQLAAKCAPDISLSALGAVAAKESRFDPLALHNNTRKVTVYAKDPASAVLLARKWMNAGESVDLGLMQIHTSNLAPLGLTLERAFDPCASLGAGAAILRAAYGKGSTPAEREAALLIAYSRYNTGRALDGVINGYAPDVMTGANQNLAPLPSETKTFGTIPVGWDVWGSGPRSDTSPWFSDYSPPHQAVLLVGTTAPAQP